MSYTHLIGETMRFNDSDETFKVYLYPNTSFEDTICEEDITDALSNLGGQLLGNESCESYSIYISYEHPDFPSESLTLSELFDDWRAYSGPNDRDTVQGAHLLVVSQDIGGYAQSPDGPGAWNDSYDAVVGFSGFDKQFYRNAVVHEVCHTYIDESLSEVADMLGGNNEHALGDVDASGDATPMATSYPNLQESGTCQSSASQSGYTRDLNSCEMDALDATSESA